MEYNEEPERERLVVTLTEGLEQRGANHYHVPWSSLLAHAPNRFEFGHRVCCLAHVTDSFCDRRMTGTTQEVFDLVTVRLGS